MSATYHYNRPIHPVPVKPRGVGGKVMATWESWPNDVRDVLRAWNRGRLSFRGDSFTFKCWRCEAYCERDGLCCMLDGREHCDECMVELARLALAVPAMASLDGREGE